MIIGANAAQAEEYRLGPGDVLSINVWGVDLVQGQVVTKTDNLAGYLVSPDGKISFPMIGEITASGLTTSQLTNAVTQALKEYLNDPKVSVNIVKLRTTRVYVLGEVNKPGMYELEKLHNVLDAIGIAGGYTKYAAKKSIFILRGGRPEKPIKVNLLKLLREGDMSQNYSLNDGDVVYLNDSGKMDFARDILPILTGGYYVNQVYNK
jgi:polysaccharide biosynthesis/export protein